MLSLLLAASLTTGLAGPPVGRPVTLAAGDSDGAVVLAVSPVRSVFSPSSFAVEIGAYSPEGQVLKTSSFGGWGTMSGIPVQDPNTRLVGRTLKPGVYALMAVSAGPFGTCFNASTVSFRVKPGVATVLGRLDADPSLTEYGRAVARHEAPSITRADATLYVFNVPAPRLHPAVLQAEDERAIRAQNPALTAPLEAAKLTPVAFKTGRDLFGWAHLCSGYYASRSPAPAPPVPAKFDAPAGGRFVRVWLPDAAIPRSPAPAGAAGAPAPAWSPSTPSSPRTAEPEGRTLDFKLGVDGSVSETR